MDNHHEERPSVVDAWKKPSSSKNELPNNISSEEVPLSFTNINNPQQQNHPKWNGQDTSILDYGISMEPSFLEFSQTNPNTNQIKIPDKEDDQTNPTPRNSNKIPEWDPRVMLNNLSFLEQKIHQLQEVVHLIMGRRTQQILIRPDEFEAQQQQLITADLTSIIVQLISTAGSLLPSMKHNLSIVSPSIAQVGQLNGSLLPSALGGPSSSVFPPQYNEVTKIPDQSNRIDEQKLQNYPFEENELKEEEDPEEGENLPPGSYEILQLEKEEILAPHTHFCTICGKGFKRDANLRMHMRGHGDKYKTPAALAKPNKESGLESMLIKRYSCPYNGCKRNKDHKKFQPLKTILCVKNHYKRTHCDKSYTCSRCNVKKFSVLADLKTHEKHCGKDKWLCSCGTTFSRKDKLFGHIALFQGHTPAIPHDESKGTGLVLDRGEGSEGKKNKVGSLNFSFGSGIEPMVDIKEAGGGGIDDPTSYFSPLSFDGCNFGGFHEFPRPPYEDPENSFSFLLQGASTYSQKSGAESSSNNL